MANIQLRNAIICDRVYQDDYELSCVNRIYPGRIVLETVPAFFELYVYCGFSVITDTPVRLEFKLEGPKVRAGGAGVLDGSSDYFEIIAPFFTFLDAPAEISFKWRIDEGRWSKPVKWEVEIDDEAVHLDSNNVDTLRALFTARGRATRLLDRAVVRSISRRRRDPKDMTGTDQT